jgi:hypothetical protein
MAKRVNQIVKPTSLAKELDIPPQVVFGWIRRGLVPHHECVCGHKYLVRHEIQEFLAKRRKEEEEKAARIQAELAGEAEA